MEIIFRKIQNNSEVNSQSYTFNKVRFPDRVRDFSLLQAFRPGSKAQPTSFTMGTRSSFPIHDSEQSPPTSAEFKNEWSYTSAPT